MAGLICGSRWVYFYLLLLTIAMGDIFMGFLELFILAVGLSMDAFAVS